ncbi:hypothetical protein HanOQP8_Chr02g0045781 [Helianthus annuus]|nr:hypothetical protein HanOQP8_Chr02g0045781 [Helianthus annuus]
MQSPLLFFFFALIYVSLSDASQNIHLWRRLFCFGRLLDVELGLIFGHTWYELVTVFGVYSSSSLKQNYYILVRFKALHWQTNYALYCILVCFNALHLQKNYALMLAEYVNRMP